MGSRSPAQLFSPWILHHELGSCCMSDNELDFVCSVVEELLMLCVICFVDFEFGVVRDRGDGGGGNGINLMCLWVDGKGKNLREVEVEAAI